MKERYQRVDEIGKGGVGTVYRGKHALLQRDVAVKEIREIFSLFGDLQKDDIIRKFEQSVQRHAQLVHPNIIQILDIDLDQQYPFFVMEFAPNRSLRHILASRQKINVEEVLSYFVAIASALRYAHHRGVLHSDLKPENVLFDESGNPKVVDFGINRIIERDTAKQIYIGVGTVAYLAPEQFKNPQDVSEQSDIYSLGIMFYEMLTGKIPGRRSPMPSSFFPDIPSKLDDVFDRMCMDAVEDRYPSVDAMLDDLLGSPEIAALVGRGAMKAAPSAAPLAKVSVAPSAPAPRPAPPMAPPAPMAPAPMAPAPMASSAPMETFEAPAMAAEPAPAEAGGDANADLLAKLNKYSKSF